MLIGIFDGLAVGSLPATFLKICVVNRWCCGQGVFKQATRIIGPDGHTAVATGKEIEIKLGAETHTATSVEIFVNPQFEKEGTYWVEILLDGQLRMRYPLAIRILQKNALPPQ